MKTMSKERFFESDITCATVINIENGKVRMQEAMYENKSGFCWDKEVYKNTNIIDLIKECSVNEKDRLYKAPKIEITTEPLDPPVDMFLHYTATLEMSAEEFRAFRKIARDGTYLIAFI